MQVILDVALPVFAIILAGYWGGKTVLGQSASQALSAFVYWFALPCVLFIGIAQQPLGVVLNLPYIGAILIPMVTVYALGMWLGRLIRKDQFEVHALQGLNSCFSNTGYMGIPLFMAAFGPDKLLPAIIATIIMSVVVVGLAVITIEAGRSKGQGIGKAVRDVVVALSKNPLILSSGLGLVWNLLGLGVPNSITTFCTLMGNSAGPCALFGIGVFLAGRPLAFDVRQVGWMVPMKLVLQPLLTFILIQTVFPLDPYWAASAILIAALPTGALVFVVASQYQVFVERTSQVILASTIVSLPVLSLLLVVFVGGR